MDLEELITLYCTAWDEPDPSRRDRMLQLVWAEDGIYADPTVYAVGRKELCEHIGKVLARLPGSRIVRSSLADAHHGMFRFTFKRVQANGETLREGIDFGELSRDGKLQRIAGFFGPPPQK